MVYHRQMRPDGTIERNTDAVNITLPYMWQPWPHQMKFWDAFVVRNTKRNVIVWHRRAGKDQTALNAMVVKAHERVGMYWYVFPEYKQGREIFWDGFRDDGRKFRDAIPQDLIARVRDDMMLIELKNGSMIKVIGTDNADSIVGPNPIGCIFSEFSLQNPTAWNLVRPILNANNGWALFVYTPRGRNHGYDMFKNALKMMEQDPDRWFAQMLTIDDTSKVLIGDDGKPLIDPVTGKTKWGPIVTQEMIEEDRATGMTEELIQQEYYCDFNAALEGAYYQKELTQARNEHRITKVAYNPSKPVHTAWDLGLDDSTAIWFFQLMHGQPVIINYKEWNNTSLKDIIKEIKEYSYIYGTHLGPHDISQRELTTKESRYNFAKRHGVKFYPVPKLTIADGIEAARRVLAMSYFDEEHCEKGLDALTNYSKKWDAQRKIYLDKPNHDWSSHGSDAFRYLAVGLEHVTEFDDELIQMQVGVAQSNYNVYSHRANNAYVARSNYNIYSHRN